MEVAFSALADDLALLTEDERSNGVLLINIGAGTTEYVVEYDCGICASGVLQIGMEHVANDISVAMNLNIDLCRSLIAEGKLARKRNENKEFLEFKTGGGLRQIPLSSFETVIDWRLREIFERAVANGQQVVTIKCSDQNVYEEISRVLLDEQMIFEFLAGEKSIAFTDNREQCSLTFWL